MNIVAPKYLMLIGKNAFPGVTYESFLIDIINASGFFSKKRSFTERYILIEEQSNGEDDAYTSTYQLDFKLLVDEEVMKARFKNMPEVDYSNISNGFVYSKSKKKVCEVPHDNIMADIMSIDIEKIRKGDYKSNTEKSLIKNLKKEKNLFMYYPYEYHNCLYTKQEFGKILTNVFSKLLSYRDEIGIDKDTFICIKVNENFLIYEWLGDSMIFRDEVHQYLCTNYMGLKAYSVY